MKAVSANIARIALITHANGQRPVLCATDFGPWPGVRAVGLPSFKLPPDDNQRHPGFSISLTGATAPVVGLARH
ncbi:hypothetical protein GONAM_15_01270 [Gordonia namibiensis NBRC 108229]|uniref:Uncharacterized protein n=1 Tax=Gordonia namibiensis NBRC 108229 TaxID=1208314 RepID=K6X7S1_9ACTN|nr:hypothetical protein GONAM_15_01270 [Gordonia namibiensis NBRC 108229]